VCLASWLQTTGTPWELIVVDNGSTDGTPAWLREFAPRAEAQGVPARVIENAGNIGCSTARNQGAAAARAPYLLFLDNDIALRSRRWLAHLAARLDADARAGVVGPKLVYPWPPHRIQCAGAAVSRTGRIQFVGRGEPRDDPRFAAPREVQCLISACFLVRRAAFERAGGFDEAFNPVEYEDIDLCYHIRDLGYTAWYEPAVEMYHFESVTTQGTPRLPNTYLIIRNGMKFKRRWRRVFERENGPTDEETRWRAIETQPLSSLGPLPVIE
jgi:GT2 family glycosyltransferase